MSDDTLQAGMVKKQSKRELWRARHRCQWVLERQCKRFAFLEDWAGWRWCLHHSLYTWRWDGGERSFWWYLKWTKIFL